MKNLKTVILTLILFCFIGHAYTQNVAGNYTGSCYFTNNSNPDENRNVGTDIKISATSYNNYSYQLKFNNNPGCQFACAGRDFTVFCDNNGNVDYMDGAYHYKGKISLSNFSGKITCYYGNKPYYMWDFKCRRK